MPNSKRPRNNTLLVTGTGTNVGKTHVAQVILQTLRPIFHVRGFKPIESGVTLTSVTDAHRLSSSATHPDSHSSSMYTFTAPVSPHLAARIANEPISIGRVIDTVRLLANRADLLVVELAGGLFSPLTPTEQNITILESLPTARTLLVAPDRLGVLHDIAATVRACANSKARIDGIILSAPEKPDESTTTNAQEIAVVTPIPVICSVPRATVDEIATNRSIAQAIIDFMTYAD